MIATSAYGKVDSLEGAALWVQHLLLGQVATSIAVIAIAAAGFTMLRGQLAARDGLRVVLGCFIMFGAAGIAKGILNAGRATAQQPDLVYMEPPAIGVRAVPPPPRQINPFDPYVGATDNN